MVFRISLTQIKRYHIILVTINVTSSHRPLIFIFLHLLIKSWTKSKFLWYIVPVNFYWLNIWLKFILFFWKYNWNINIFLKKTKWIKIFLNLGEVMKINKKWMRINSQKLSKNLFFRLKVCITLITQFILSKSLLCENKKHFSRKPY